jgi:EAL domain-containing protein (putative c-di-GMP-specific phosphodiesterase class I)
VAGKSLVHVTAVSVRVRGFANLGIKGVDDFGTGYSSIAHLRDLPVQGLKLDRSFTHDITAVDPTSLRLAQGLVGLAQGLGLATIAEGVETQREADLLAAQGWELAQGWLFGRPTPLHPPADRVSGSFSGS